MSNSDRDTEIKEAAIETALFFLTLVTQGVPLAEAAALTGSWMISGKFDVDGPEPWKGGA